VQLKFNLGFYCVAYDVKYRRCFFKKKKNKDGIVAAGGIDAVLECMKKSGANTRVLDNCCSVLINLSAGHVRNQVLLQCVAVCCCS